MDGTKVRGALMIGGMAWAAIIGGKRDGKREALEALFADFDRLGVRFRALHQEPLEDEGRICGYDLLQAPAGDRIPLARTSSNPTLCDLEFYGQAFERGRDWVQAPADVVVLPVGKLEIAKTGHWPAIDQALNRARTLSVLSVRPHLLASLALALPDPVAHIELPAAPGELTAFAETLVSLHGLMKA